jgi:hypothetical protein
MLITSNTLRHNPSAWQVTAANDMQILEISGKRSVSFEDTFLI